MSINEVKIEEIERAILKFFNRKDAMRTGRLIICGVKFPRDSLKIWLRSMLEGGAQVLRISAGISMVHGHRTVLPADMQQGFRIVKEGSDLLDCVCQQENVVPAN